MEIQARAINFSVFSFLPIPLPTPPNHTHVDLFDCRSESLSIKDREKHSVLRILKAIIFSFSYEFQLLEIFFKMVLIFVIPVRHCWSYFHPSPWAMLDCKLWKSRNKVYVCLSLYPLAPQAASVSSVFTEYLLEKLNIEGIRCIYTLTNQEGVLWEALE